MRLDCSSKPLISIIIPVFNAQAHIARAIESCMKQSLDSIEIIIVDDCGQDNSIAIAKDYAKRDDRICIVRNSKNLGTFGARIKGIKAARGEYLTFLDADDCLMPQTCACIAYIIKDKPDIIHFKSLYIGSTESSLLANAMHKARYIMPICFCQKPLYDEQITYNFFLKNKHFPKFTLVDKCYKRELLTKALPFLESIKQPLLMAEDMLTFYIISCFAKSYIGLNVRLYEYCLNNHSIMQNKNYIKIHKKINDMCLIGALFEDFAPKLYPYNSYARVIADKMSCNLIALSILEARFLNATDFDEIMRNLLLDKKGGGRYVRTSTLTFTHFALFTHIFARLYAFIAFLESQSYLYTHVCLYSKFWIYQTLNHFRYTKAI